MEKLYLIEIFVDKLVMILDEEDKETNTEKELIIRSMFGGRPQFIIKENQLAIVPRRDEIYTDYEPNLYRNNVKGAKRWARTFRVGKSFLFPEFPEGLIKLLEDFPLEFQVWSGEESEKPGELIGTGNVFWHTFFFSHIRATKNDCTGQVDKALSIRETVPIMAECCCVQIADLHIILRLSCLGDVLNTQFQQLTDTDPDSWLFQTYLYPSVFECKRIENDDPEYNTKDSIYEIAAREDPEVVKQMQKKIEVCTELESCGMNRPGTAFACKHPVGAPIVDPKDCMSSKKYPIDKIRMGDITGPCGNLNCPIAHKMKTFIRNQYAYKKETYKQKIPDRPPGKRTRVCGQCACNNDGYHAEKPDGIDPKPKCALCGGVAQTGETCDARLNKLHGTGMTPISSKTELLLNKAAMAKGGK